MKKHAMYFATLLLALLFVLPAVSYSQDEDITEPVSVWNLTFVRTKANMGDDYLKNS